MNRMVRRWYGSAALLCAVAGTLGCAPLGSALETVDPPSSRNTVVYGEVRQVNPRSERIQLRQDNGRTLNVRYDGRTRVVHRQRNYPVSALEAGDLVSVRVVYDRGNQARAQLIEVRENVRERGRRAERVQRVDGTVGWVDTRRGSFSVSSQRNQSLVVLVPHGLSRADQHRFDRLRRGDRVRADVRSVGRNQFELVRFR